MGDFVNSRVKLSARAALTGSQIKIVPFVAAIMALFLLFSVCNELINRLNIDDKSLFVIFSVLSLFLTVAVIGPLRLLLEIKLLLLARGINPVRRPDLGFSGILKSCEMCVRLFFIKLFWLTVFEAIPIMAGAVFVWLNLNKSVSLNATYAVLTGLILLAFVGVGFYSVYIQRYSKAMFYLACYKDFSVSDAIRESIRKTQNRLSEIFFFKLSFLPWLLLCIGVLPALYVIPYYKQSVTCFFLSR